MTKEEAAARLNGNQYSKEGSKVLWSEMKAAGLVAVFGASDDLMEFRGAFEDEVDCYGDGRAYLAPSGLLENECEEEECPYHAKQRATAPFIKALWNDGSGPQWRYETTIPHASFTIMEDGDTYCRGIVFALADVNAHGAPAREPTP